jgi:hypothetical protein
VSVLPNNIRRIHSWSELGDVIENGIEWLILGCASHFLFAELFCVLKGFMLGVIGLKSDEGANWLRILIIVSFISNFLVDLLVELEHFFIAHGLDHLASSREQKDEVLVVVGESDVAHVHLELRVDVRIENLFELLGGFRLIVQLQE